MLSFSCLDVFIVYDFLMNLCCSPLLKMYLRRNLILPLSIHLKMNCRESNLSLMKNCFYCMNLLNIRSPNFFSDCRNCCCKTCLQYLTP